MDELQCVGDVISYLTDLLINGVRPLIIFKEPKLSSDWEDTYIQPGMKADLIALEHIKPENIYAFHCRLFPYVDYNRQFQLDVYQEPMYTDYFVVSADNADREIKDRILIPVGLTGLPKTDKKDLSLSLIVGA